MRHRSMGSSGLSVSRLALGTMTWGTIVDEDVCRDQLRAFVDAGGDLLDTAFGYGGGASESLIGSLIGDVVDRDEVLLCTKAGISRVAGERRVDASRGTLMRQLEASLERLGTTHVDLWLVHSWSDETPLSETLGALEWAVTSGRARYVGVSNYSAWQTARAFSLLESARVPLVANEVEYSLTVRGVEEELVPAAQSLGIGLIPWSPLAQGVLTGKYRGAVPADSRAASGDFPLFRDTRLSERSARIVEAVVTAARGLEVTPTEVALAWVRDRPGVVAPIVGARTLAQLRTALASEDVELPVELVAALAEVSA